METIIKDYPLPIAGLILGILALGNLIQSWGEIFRNVLGIIGVVLLLIFIAKLIVYPKIVKEELNNPVVASVFPTFTMAIMVLSTYIKPISSVLANGMWLFGVLLHGFLILWFAKKFVLNFDIKKVFPSWYIVFVGIVVGSVTAQAHGMEDVGKAIFWFGFVSYLALLFPILYRVIKIKNIPEPALPTLTILAAPGGLCLAGYISSFTQKNIWFVYFLMLLSLIFYIIAIVLLPRLMKLKFYPSYSGFTFPLVINGIGMKLANGFLIKSDRAIPMLKHIVTFQEIVAVLITLYVLVKYIQFLGTLGRFNLKAKETIS